MKKYLYILAIQLLTIKVFPQFIIGSGATFTASGNAIISVKDLNMNIDGSFNPGTSTFHFYGSLPTSISANAMPTFYKIELTKSNDISLSLNTNINIKSEINFISGLLELNQKNIILEPTALLVNESESSRITGINGGEVSITGSLNAPNAINLGNLGATITSASNLGSLTIKRGHKSQTGTGMSAAINRYYDIQPTNNANLNATLRLKYFDAEMNGLSENTVSLMKSKDMAANWTNETISSNNSTTNFVEKTSVNDFSIWTLGISSSSTPLPITGLEFSAKRINNAEVQLNWKTRSETENLGFYIERKFENETQFNSINFVQSSANGDISSAELKYQNIDENNFNGNTYYRIKQVDFDGKFSYSAIKAVKGSENNNITMNVWPIPALDRLNISVTGIDKEDTIQIFDLSGKMVKEISINANQNHMQISGLNSGIYIVRLASDGSINKKIIVQN